MQAYRSYGLPAGIVWLFSAALSFSLEVTSVSACVRLSTEAQSTSTFWDCRQHGALPRHGGFDSHWFLKEQQSFV